MIVFDLSCAIDHCFEAWFQSQESFEDQREAAMISCPFCGSTQIHRVPSAIHLATRASSPARPGDSTLSPSKANALLALQQFVAAVVSSSEDVGSSFADEARKIHYLESPSRAIRGQASADDVESLCEEGIEVLCLPVPKKELLN